jgi:DHA1 family tetracycline resistance protein-like MFS transporter
MRVIGQRQTVNSAGPLYRRGWFNDSTRPCSPLRSSCVPILLFTIVLSGMGFGLVLPAFLFFAENIGASPAIATAIVGSYSLGQAIATPFWGRMSDRYGRKPILLISTFGMGLGYLALAFADNLWLLGGARIMTGLLGGNIAVAMAYVTDVTPIEKRAQGMGMVGGAISLGFIVGPALGGLLAGADADSATLLWPGIAAAVLCFLTVIATFFVKESLPVEKRVGPGSEHHVSGLDAARTVFRRSVLAQMVVVGFMVYFAMAQFETIMPLWSEFKFGWGPREIGYCFTYLGLVVMIVQGFLVGRLAPIFGEGKLVMVGVAAYIFGVLWMTQAPGWEWMMIGISFTAGGGALAVTSMTSLVSRNAEEHERGLVLGVFNSGAWTGRSIGPLFSGLLFQSVDEQAPLYVAAMVMLTALGLVAIVRRRGRRRQAAKSA